MRPLVQNCHLWQSALSPRTHHMSSQNFIVSARKYRPETWDAVVGQKSITATLQNAIAKGQIAQSYLFCGPRGVGKTTCARIFARSINGFDPSAQTDYAFNIFELDAATHNGVDDIREITDQVRIPPQIGQYKVYVIDEVHMLSTAAFNAFLKTLEEPPAHAVFILATTEKHKIIPTILSRCQIFDFHRIEVADIADHLASIAEKENITYEKEGLHIIAQKAEGALRDALSMFDQITAFSGGNVSYKAVIENLNILDYDYYFRVTDAVLQSDTRESLLILDEILRNGFDAHHFLSGLAMHLRDLMVAKDESTLSLLESTESVKERYKTQSAEAGIHFLVNGMGILNQADVNFRASKNQRFLTELSLIQLCTAAQKEAEKKNDFDILMPFTGARVPMPRRGSSTPGEMRQSPSIVRLPKREPELMAKPTGRLLNSEVKVVNLGHRTGLFDLPDLEPISKAEESGPEMNESFTPEDFERVWREYAGMLKELNKLDLHFALTHEMPVLNESQITLRLDNKALVHAVDEIKNDLMRHVRDGLRNTHVSFNYFYQADENVSVQIFGDKEVYEHMVTVNPALKSLRDALKLEFDR